MERDEVVGEVLHDVLESGWMRMLPDSAIDIFGAAASLAAEDRAGQLQHGLPPRWAKEGLEAPAWSPLSPDNLEDSEAIRLRREHEAVVARAATHVGVTPPVTMADLAELMRRLGLIQRQGTGAGTHWSVTQPVPLPEECFPLTDEERSHEDRVRWQGLHYRNSQTLIRHFVDSEITTMSTSLENLGERLDTTPQGAREAVLVLLDEGDFHSNVDMARVGESDVFELAVDWEKFKQTRISVRMALPDDDVDE